jgi:glycosyl-4,4'-diaponeurosporenoate acyltransferase
LPDAGSLFPGGLRKRELIGRDRSRLERLVAETRRAEWEHLGIWPFWLATALWLPPWAVVVNLLFATAFNLPCLWLQRYNRLRLLALLARLGP